jgi:hypothetical protein
VGLSDEDRAWLQDHRSAAMVTIGDDGLAKVARVGVALVEGELWSSGTAGRVRTQRLREDPRCTLFVFDPAYAWMALETSVSILDGPDAPQLNLRLFRQMQGRASGPLNWFGSEVTEPEFLRTMVDDGRLIYRFDVERTYGTY